MPVATIITIVICKTVARGEEGALIMLNDQNTIFCIVYFIGIGRQITLDFMEYYKL